MFALLGAAATSPYPMLDIVNGGTLDMTWEDCRATGLSGAHVTVTDVQPPTFQLGDTTTIAGAGDLDETETEGTFEMTMTGVGGAVLLNNCNGDASQKKECDIALGPIKTGSLSFQGFEFPIKAGKIAGVPKIDLTLGAAVPSFAASTNTTLLTKNAAGEPVICVHIYTKPAPAISQAS